MEAIHQGRQSASTIAPSVGTFGSIKSGDKIPCRTASSGANRLFRLCFSSLARNTGTRCAGKDTIMASTDEAGKGEATSWTLRVPALRRARHGSKLLRGSRVLRKTHGSGRIKSGLACLVQHKDEKLRRENEKDSTSNLASVPLLVNCSSSTLDHPKLDARTCP